MDETEYKLMTEELKKELTDNKKKVQINEEKAELFITAHKQELFDGHFVPFFALFMRIIFEIRQYLIVKAKPFFVDGKTGGGRNKTLGDREHGMRHIGRIGITRSLEYFFAVFDDDHAVVFSADLVKSLEIAQDSGGAEAELFQIFVHIFPLITEIFY